MAVKVLGSLHMHSFVLHGRNAFLMTLVLAEWPETGERGPEKWKGESKLIWLSLEFATASRA